MKQQTKHTAEKKHLNNYQELFKTYISKINWVNSMLSVLLIGALLLTFHEIQLFRKTLIHWSIPTTIWFLTGLILTPLTRNLLKKHYDTSGFFLQLVFNVFTWGGLLISGLMATNYYFSNDTSKIISTKIIRTGHLAKGRNGCEEPYCEVIIDNQEKELVFPCDIHIENYNEVELTIRKGFLGFDVIAEQRLTMGK